MKQHCTTQNSRTHHKKLYRSLSSIILVTIICSLFGFEVCAESIPFLYYKEKGSIFEVNDYQDLEETHGLSVFYLLDKKNDDQVVLLPKEYISAVVPEDDHGYTVQLASEKSFSKKQFLTIHIKDGTVLSSVVVITWWRGWFYYQDSETYGYKVERMVLESQVERIVSPKGQNLDYNQLILNLKDKKQAYLRSLQKRKNLVSIGYNYVQTSLEQKDVPASDYANLTLSLEDGHGFVGGFECIGERTGKGWGASFGGDYHTGDVIVESGNYQDLVPFTLSQYSLAIVALYRKQFGQKFFLSSQFGPFLTYSLFELVDNPYFRDNKRDMSVFGAHLGGELSLVVQNGLELCFNLHYRPVFPGNDYMRFTSYKLYGGELDVRLNQGLTFGVSLRIVPDQFIAKKK